MSLRTLFDSLKRCSRRGPDARTRRPAARPRLEALEDRSVPTGGSGWIPDPVGDFLPTYTGPHDPGLDVTAHRVMVTQQRVIFAGKMAGAIAPTQEIGGLYIVGLDRGQGTPRFLNGTPQIGPNVKWDLIVRINPDGTGVVNNQIAGVVTRLDPADIAIDGDEFTAGVPLGVLLHAAARPPEEWTYNLWPRNGLVPGQNQNVSDLAPDDGNSPVRIVPPPRTASPGQLEPRRLASSGFDIDFVPAFRGLDVAARNLPGEPSRFAPVFALNYGTGSQTFAALRGLQSAYSRLTRGNPTIPPNPVHVSPVFFGLANGISVDGPLT